MSGNNEDVCLLVETLLCTITMVYYLHRNTKCAVFGCVSFKNRWPHINIMDKMFIVNCNTSFCLMVICRKWKLKFSAAK